MHIAALRAAGVDELSANIGNGAGSLALGRGNKTLGAIRVAAIWKRVPAYGGSL